MEHQEVLERLEFAAVEPGGLERLTAGDTPEAAAVAGHLAGCDQCATELERLRRAVPLLRDAIRTIPPVDLRDRTLAYVRTHGLERGQRTDAGATTPEHPADIPRQGPVGAPAMVDARASSRRRAIGVLPWVASIAAAVVISVAASAVIVGGRLDTQMADQQRTISGLEAVTTATLEITSDPGSRRVELVAVGSAVASGSLLFSPTTTNLVVVASGLEPPPAGREYRCWILIDGQRQNVGRMNLADDLAYWVGATPSVATVPPGTTFGVSLSEVGGSGLETDPVIVGSL
jgi:hypothetical protein